MWSLQVVLPHNIQLVYANAMCDKYTSKFLASLDWKFEE